MLEPRSPRPPRRTPRMLLPLAGLALLFCTGSDSCGCEEGPLKLQADVSDYPWLERNCADLACPLARGAEVAILGARGTDTGDTATPTAAAAEPADILEVNLEGAALTVRGLAEGTAELTVQFGEEEARATIPVAAIGSTDIVLPIVLELDPQSVGWRTDALALLAGTATEVCAHHLDTTGAPLMGRGVATWSVPDEQSAAVTVTPREGSRCATLQASGSAELVRVSAGVEVLDVRVASPYEVQQLALYELSTGLLALVEGQELILTNPDPDWGLTTAYLFHAAAVTDDGWYVAGTGTDAFGFAISGEASVLDIGEWDAAERWFFLLAGMPGRVVLGVQVGAHLAEFVIHVREPS